LNRDSLGEEANVDSVTKSGLQCTDFLVLPVDDAVRFSFGPFGSGSDPDPLGVVVEWPLETWDWDSASGFGCSIVGLVGLDFGIRFGVRVVKQNFGDVGTNGW